MPAAGVREDLFGLTGPTSASGVSAETVWTLKAHEPVYVTLGRETLERLLTPSGSGFYLGSDFSSEHARLFWVAAKTKADLLARIKARRRRLLRERGLFSDSVGMIRELRDAGG